jgi:hypothetical protein
MPDKYAAVYCCGHVLILSTGNFRKHHASMLAAIGLPYDREER